MRQIPLHFDEKIPLRLSIINNRPYFKYPDVRRAGSGLNVGRVQLSKLVKLVGL